MNRGLIAVFLMLATVVIGQDYASLRDMYEEHSAHIETVYKVELKTIGEKYVRALDSLRESRKKVTDLDGMIELRKEKVRFLRDGWASVVPVDDVYVARAMRYASPLMMKAAYLRDLKELELLSGYLKALDREKKKLTREDKLDDAVAVYEEEKRIKAKGKIVGARVMVARKAKEEGESEARRVVYVPRNGLVLWYDFDKARGDKVLDKSGRNHHGKVVGAEWVKSERGGAYEFDGKQDYLNTVVDSGLSGSFTMAFWVQPKSKAGEGSVMVASNVERYWNYWVAVSGNKTGGARLNMYDGRNNPAADSKSSISVDRWTHLVAVRDARSGNTRLYMDGSLEAEAKDTTTSVPVYGSFTVGAQPEQKRYFHGLLDDVMIWDRALSDLEIKGLYESQGGKKVYKPIVSSSEVTRTPILEPRRLGRIK